MNYRHITAAALACTLAATGAWAQGTPSSDGAAVYIIGIADGDTVTSPLTVRFGLSGMGVAPAGTEADGTGHHHLFIDTPPPGEGEFGAEELLTSIPADGTHIHFGGGQTETMIELEPGTHTLQIVLADAYHVPHTPPVMSAPITVTVE